MDKEQRAAPVEDKQQNVTKEENATLLSTNKATNGNVPCNANEQEPADGGWKAYLVLFASFVTNGLIFGVINSYSVIYTEMLSNLKKAGVTNPAGNAALVGSLGMGTTFLMSAFAGALTNFMGLRRTAVFGGCLATTGMFLSSFFVNHVEVLYFSYGIMYGTGTSLVYTPSLAILSSYFKKRLGLANGFVCLGSSCFTMIMPPIMDHMIYHYGLAALFRLLALFTSVVILCGLLFKPIPMMVIQRNKNENILKSIINVHIWKILPYRFWTLCMVVTLCGYFVPYVHIKQFIEETFPTVNSNIPLQCIAFASGVGRLLFGFLADKPNIDPVTLQQFAFFAIGASTIIMPFIRVFPILAVVALFIGLFDGAFVSLMGPIAVQLCGGAHAAQSIGYVLAVASIALSLGPPVAGILYNVYGSYTLPFALSGCFPVLGAILMFSIHAVRRSAKEKQRLGDAEPLGKIKSDHQSTLLLKDQANSDQTCT